MQYFYINKDSVLPTLRVELVNDGRYDFAKETYLYSAIQNADVTFSMINENGDLKISDAPASIVLSNDDRCDERYVLEYKWKKRDTRTKGQFKGLFKITFKDDIVQEGVRFDAGDLIVPIYEDLIIFVK